MKIAAIIDNTVGAGGGFDQALNAVVQMQRLSSGRFDFEVFTSQPSNVEVLGKFGVNAVSFKYTWLDRLFIILANSQIWQRAQQRLRLMGPLEKKLMLHGVDLVYFVTPAIAALGLQRINYITTVWDLCHRDTPEFPEVREFNTFFMRESLYRHLFAPAILVLTDSPELADRASFRYGVDRDRFLPMPFSASPLLREATLTVEEVRSRYQIPLQYFYYPAQFWAHKNHIRILDALCILREKHKFQPIVVFSGKDYGNLNWVKNSITKRRLESQVIVLGFVASEEVSALYQGAAGIVMPTYFGPTNLPPLEAWSIGVPLIYSANLSGQVRDAAEMVDPDDAQSIANAMLNVLSYTRRAELIAAGKRRLEEIDSERALAEHELFKRLELFSIRRHCWSNE